MIDSAWRSTAEIDELIVLDDGWHYRSDEADRRLAASIARYGQVRPVVVRRDAAGRMVVVDGRSTLRAMEIARAGRTVTVVDVGPISPTEAMGLALALEIRPEIDYARLAFAVAELIASGRSVTDLATLSPFTAERLRYMDTLSRFDWSQFSAAVDGQARMDWDTEAADLVEPSAPASLPLAEPEAAQETTVAEVERVLEHAAPAEVVEAVKTVVERGKKGRQAGPSLFDLGDE